MASTRRFRLGLNRDSGSLGMVDVFFSTMVESWRFPFRHGGTPKSSIDSQDFPFWGSTIYGNLQMVYELCVDSDHTYDTEWVPPPIKQLRGLLIQGFHSYGGSPIAGWFISWKVPQKYG